MTLAQADDRRMLASRQRQPAWRGSQKDITQEDNDKRGEPNKEPLGFHVKTREWRVNPSPRNRTGGPGLVSVQPNCELRHGSEIHGRFAEFFESAERQCLLLSNWLSIP